MKIQQLFFLLILILLPLSCTSDYANNSLPDDKVVVQGYIYSDHDVQRLSLNYTFSLNSSDTIGQPVTDAAVAVYVNDIVYPFYHNQDMPGEYFSLQGFLQPKAGDRLRLEVLHQQNLIEAYSSMPPAPVNLQLSRKDMRFPNKDMADLTSAELNNLPNIAIDITWDQQSLGQYYYFAKMRNIDANPNALKIYGPGVLAIPTTFSTNLRALNGFSVDYKDVSHTGAHVVSVYRVNQEYADLYGTLFDQNARGVQAPATNVENGLGIFTGFTCSTDTFFVVQK